MTKTMIVGAVAAFLSGLLFHILFPAILGAIIATVISGASLLDPLYAAERTGTAWRTLGSVLIINTLHTFVTAVGTGTLLAYLSKNISSGWLYLIGMIIAVFLHLILLPLFAAILTAFSREMSPAIWTISILLLLFNASMIALIAIFSVRRWG